MPSAVRTMMYGMYSEVGDDDEYYQVRMLIMMMILLVLMMIIITIVYHHVSYDSSYCDLFSYSWSE